MYICLLKGTNLTTFSSFPYNVCRSPRRVNNAISLLSPRILCEGNGNLSSWSFSNIYLSSGLRNIRGPWHSRWQDYMVGEEQWVILRMSTNIRRIPKRYTIWPWEVWVIHYVSVFQSDSSPQLWYRWEVSCESWKYYNINMIYMRALWISSLCFFRIIFVSFEIHMIFWPYTRFYWFSLMIYWLTLFCFFNHVKLIDSMLPQVYTVIYHSSRRQNVISALLKK